MYIVVEAFLPTRKSLNWYEFLCRLFLFSSTFKPIYWSTFFLLKSIQITNESRQINMSPPKNTTSCSDHNHIYVELRSNNQPRIQKGIYIGIRGSNVGTKYRSVNIIIIWQPSSDELFTHIMIIIYILFWFVTFDGPIKLPNLGDTSTVRGRVLIGTFLFVFLVRNLWMYQFSGWKTTDVNLNKAIKKW